MPKAIYMAGRVFTGIVRGFSSYLFLDLCCAACSRLLSRDNESFLAEASPTLTQLIMLEQC